MSKKERSVVRDLLPDLGELAEAARSILANRNQGPLHRLGFRPGDLANLALLPEIRRGRDYRVYGKDRWIDLHRGDGSQILGYSVPRQREALKNRIDQGLVSGVPGPLHDQVRSRLHKFFPRHELVMCPDRYRVQSAMEVLGISTGRAMVPSRDDLSGVPAGGSYGFWLPFALGPSPVCLAHLPSMSLQGPWFLLVEKDLYRRQLGVHGKDAPVLDDFLASLGTMVPSWSLSPVLSGLHALEVLGAFAGYVRDPEGLGASGNLRTRDLQGRLGTWRESWWSKVRIGPSWHRVGPYLMHDLDEAAYGNLFSRALEKGVLLNPRHQGLNIIPGIMSDGEMAALNSLMEG